MIYMASFFLSLLQIVIPSFYWSALVRCLAKNKTFIFCNPLTRQIKFTRDLSVKVQRGSRDIAPAVFPQGRDVVSILHDTGWVLEPIWMGVEDLTLTGI
jgi:hypothetical protein